MGKKIQKLMEEHRVLFLKGAAANGIPDEKAREIFDLMEKFGRYGFNKAHSAAYALIAFQTAYLKTHFPVEFMAALLTSEMHSSDGVVKYINECRNHDITVLPPGINESGKVFTISGKNIRFGLVAVKNVGESAIDAIIEEREKGHFSSLFDFCERVDLRKVNKRVIESLIKCGALDSTGHHRAQMMAALEDAVDYGQQVQREKADRQMSLFDVLDTNPEAFMPPMPDVSEWEANDLLDLEKETLGFYISGHPLDRYHEIIEKFTNCNAVIITEKNVGEGVRIGGLIRENKVIRTKSNELMGFVTIEDMHGSLEVTVFSSLYNRVSDLLTEDTPVLLQGKVEKDDKSVKLIAGDVIRMEEAEEKWTANVCFYVDVNRSDRELLIKLREIVVRHPGSCRGFLHLQDAGKTETIISFPESIRIKAGQELVREVKGLLGANGIETQCSVIKFPDQNYRTKGKYRHA
jgi:DNA polymerase-3 subunit alpha